MKCDELKPIELECNMGKDVNGVEHREPWKAYDIDEVDAAIAELKQKLEDAQREVNNYRRHANECEGLAAKGDIDKVSLLEEIKDLKNDKELLDSQLYGFLQLEEECGGGDLRNYIAELKQKLHDAEMRADLAEAAETERKIDYDKLKAENARLKDKRLDVKDAAHILKAFNFYLCQLTHCAYDERTAQWIIDNWEQDYDRVEAYK